MDSSPLHFDRVTESADVVRQAFQNGRWVDSDQLSLSVSDAGFTQSVTAVERLRAYGGKWFQLHRHLQRFASTASTLRIQGLPDQEELAKLMDELLSRNAAWLRKQSELIGESAFGAVVFATPGSVADGNRSAEPTLVMDLHAIDAAACDDWIRNGSALVITSIQQPPPESWSRQAKVRCRLHYYLADCAASDQVTGANGILLDQDGTVTETSLSNVLIVESGTLICPEPAQILRGVSLQVVIELAECLDIPVRFERINPERVRKADEVLQTGTRCGVWFANSIDGSSKCPAGSVYLRLRAAFESLVTT